MNIMKISPTARIRLLFYTLLSVTRPVVQASEDSWWLETLKSVLPSDQVKVIQDAEEEEGRKAPLRVFKKEFDLNHRTPTQTEIEEARKVRTAYEDFCKKMTNDQWMQDQPLSYVMLNDLSNSYNGIKKTLLLEKEKALTYLLAKDNAETYRQEMESRWQNFMCKKDSIVNSWRDKLNELSEQENRFLKELRTLEGDVTLYYPQTPTIQIDPFRNWKDILLLKLEEEISSILTQWFVIIDQIPHGMDAFLIRCGYKTGDKVVMFFPKKALKFLQRPKEQSQEYELLTKNQGNCRQFIDDFWHDENRIQFDPDVLKYPDKMSEVQASLDAFVQYLQNLSDQPYWRSYIVFLHAVLAAPATRLKALDHLAMTCGIKNFTPQRNQVNISVGDGRASSTGSTKNLSIPPLRGSFRTNQVKKMNDQDLVGPHELGHLGDPLSYSSWITEIISDIVSDKTLDIVVPELYNVRYNDSFSSKWDLPDDIQLDMETARNNPEKVWPKGTASKMAWPSHQEFWNIMCLRLIEIKTDRFFCLNPYGDNITLLNIEKPIRSVYFNITDCPAKVDWTDSGDLDSYKSFLKALSELNAAD